MNNNLYEKLEKYNALEYVKKHLKNLFQIAEIDSSRDGKIGMEVGVVREKIIVSLLIKVFGRKNVDTDIKTTESELDVKCFGEEISIKTITGFKGSKLSWTVDSNQAKKFVENYFPKCSIILVIIDWHDKTNKGGFYYIPQNTQIAILKRLKNDYFKLPKEGTNSRGVEMSKKALEFILNEKNTRKIEIIWKKENLKYDPLQRWIDEWDKVIN